MWFPAIQIDAHFSLIKEFFAKVRNSVLSGLSSAFKIKPAELTKLPANKSCGGMAAHLIIFRFLHRNNGSRQAPAGNKINGLPCKTKT